MCDGFLEVEFLGVEVYVRVVVSEGIEGVYLNLLIVKFFLSGWDEVVDVCFYYRNVK